MVNKKETIFSGLVWRFAERMGAQGIRFVVSIVLARLLSPEHYGTIALVTVFTSILQVFVDSGLGNALIQKKDADDLDFSTVFYFNMGMCTVLYLGMFFAAPAIANFYDDASLTSVVRVLSLTLIISGIKNVQQAYVSRHMLFKRFFYSTLGGTILSAVLGIVMAYFGFGVWALVVQQLSNAMVDTIILWFTVKWRPKLMFSFKRFKALFSFGWKLLISSLLQTAYTEVRQLIIGKLYTSSDLAYYNRGEQFPSLIVTNINSSIDSVLLPALSDEQDDKLRVREMTRRAIKISVYVMAPMMIGLAAVSSSFVRILLTEKWSECVPYVRIFCITYLFLPIHTANLNAIKALGRSDLFLKLEIIKKVVGIALLLASMNFGVMAMAYSMLISCVASQIINSWPNKKLLDYGYLNQLKDILPSLLLAFVMGVCVWLIELLKWNDWITLIVQVALGILIYLGGSYIFKIDSFTYICSFVKQKFKEIRNK
ncbi:MAG: lipopolysaccharide biosynthesis protein [Eubacterium sp.]